MATDIPSDLEAKAEIMREFMRLRAAGKPVPPELYAKHVNATNDNYPLWRKASPFRAADISHGFIRVYFAVRCIAAVSQSVPLRKMLRSMMETTGRLSNTAAEYLGVPIAAADLKHL